MTGAALGDRLGRRRLFAAGLGLFAAASAACALAQNIGWLIAARAIQGAGAAVQLPLALALLSAGFPPPQRPRALGIFGAVTGLGVVLGPLVGGAVVQGISWPWIFWLNVPIGLATIALTRVRIDESFGPDSALDLPGLALPSRPRCRAPAPRPPRIPRRSPNREFAASGAPYDRWFKDSLKEFFPPFVDFDQPVPANETVWDWTRS